LNLGQEKRSQRCATALPY